MIFNFSFGKENDTIKLSGIKKISMPVFVVFSLININNFKYGQVFIHILPRQNIHFYNILTL
jgi:hypothetical protein